MFQRLFFLSVLLVSVGSLVANAQPPHLSYTQADKAAAAQQAEDSGGIDTAAASAPRRCMHPRQPRLSKPMQFMSSDEQDSMMQARGPRIASDKVLVAGYGADFIRLIHLMDQFAPGIGLVYERLLGKSRHFGLVLPFSLTAGIEGTGYIAHHASSFVLKAPGLKFYPGRPRSVTYAIGPSIFFGYGHDSFRENDAARPTARNGTLVDRYKVGFLINNYLNVQVDKRFSFSMILGLGHKLFNTTVLLDHTSPDYGELESAHISVGKGYRF